MVEKKIAVIFRLNASPDFASLSDLAVRSQQRSAIGGNSRAGYMER